MLTLPDSKTNFEADPTTKEIIMPTNTTQTRNEIEERVIECLKHHPKIDPSKLSPYARFQDDLGLDSLDNVGIVMAVEEEFSIELPDRDADEMRSINQIVDYLLTKTDTH
jgi:NADH dehydrogenase (ubiquinone) 1 alpha/beta subcomplex 1